jgi:hypothetical protein
MHIQEQPKQAVILPGTEQEMDHSMRLGSNNCSKCSCAKYEKEWRSDYCECGHSYDDHW